MYLLTIIPISRGIPFDVLSYYASEPVESGCLVAIPFNRTTITGIVVDATPLAQAKSMIKHAKFSLKKITGIIGSAPRLTELVHAAQETSLATLTPIGAVVASVVPHILFEYMSGEKTLELLANPRAGASKEVESVQIGTTAERIDAYKRTIRTAFAAKESVLFVAPSIRSLELWQQALEKGIGKHVITLHSKMTKKNLRASFVALKQSDRPVIIFATPGFSFVPRNDIGTIILEDESSNLYKTSDRYAIDTRIFLLHLGRETNASILWGDTLPRFETLERLGSTHLPRTFIPDKLRVVPCESYRTILPREVMETIKHAEAKKRRIFIYASHKGIAPLSRCSDCGSIVQCPSCTLPMVLRAKTQPGGTSMRSFICTHCGDTLAATHTCTYCQSWNITPVAIGTESIRDAIAELVGADAIITVDDNLTPDTKDIESLIESVAARKFVVVIGTAKVLPYLKGIEYCLLPFFDRLLSVPSLYTLEHVMRLVMNCNERAENGVLIFTRNADFTLINQLETQKINAIIHDELAVRRELGYPPFGSLIKISITVPEGHRLAIIERVQEFLATTEATMLPARRVTMGSMKVCLSWILKVPTTYVEEEGITLAAFLESLKFPHQIEQNPERI